MAAPSIDVDAISRQSRWPRRVPVLLATLLLGALAARLGVRLALGETQYFALGYSSFYRLAENIVRGGDVCFGGACPRPPLYPLFLVPAVLAGKNWLFIVIPQALLGTGTALVAFLIGRELFDARTGLLACAAAAFYPYYVVHDTALQDTTLATFALALAVWLTLRAVRLRRTRDFIAAGLALGAVVLVRAALAPTVALALVWIAVATPGSWPLRLRTCAIAALAAGLFVTPWLMHTARVTGTPTLTTDTGYELWVGNNPYTFLRFPRDSIDASSAVARSHFTAAEREALRILPGNPRAWNGWFGQRARDHMTGHPLETIRNAARKIAIGLSWRITPYRDGAAQLLYASAYLPVAVLGTIGMVVTWRRRETQLMALLLIAFAGVTAVFSAQTSHRVYLDVFWMVYAAYVVAGIAQTLARRRSSA
ncbi:MAG TPA: glycosyltransferase family 39 protein [Pseudolabrys sp.]|nr:glycosyltransferase family 39 protein [Pseudolabrys sp.]